MTAPADWRSAFPIQQAKRAADALCQGWAELAKQHRPEFNPDMKEPALTKRLGVYVRYSVARKNGLLGHWMVEDVTGEIDAATAEFDERRTDIAYCWNDDTQNMKIVFEFKRLGRGEAGRNKYFGEDGLGRFVSGAYSREDSVAAMAVILLDPEDVVVPPIRDALKSDVLAKTLRLHKTKEGKSYTRPSALFKQADFDTEHQRDATHDFAQDTIQISHFFFSFGYPTTTQKPKKKKNV